MTHQDVIPGQLDVDDVIDLALDEGAGPPAVAAPVGDVVSPAAELAAAFVATLAARPQTQETYRQACRRFIAWLGPDALTLASVSAQGQDPSGRRGRGLAGGAGSAPARR